jgi:hypothetical protein
MKLRPRMKPKSMALTMTCEHPECEYTTEIVGLSKCLSVLAQIERKGRAFICPKCNRRPDE